MLETLKNTGTTASVDNSNVDGSWPNVLYGNLQLSLLYALVWYFPWMFLPILFEWNKSYNYNMQAICSAVKYFWKTEVIFFCFFDVNEPPMFLALYFEVSGKNFFAEFL